MLKECKEEISPIILDIVNSSLDTSSILLSHKKAVVRPLLKKPSLDRNLFKSVRPLSNLCTMSKILEKMVCSKFNNYLDKNNFRSQSQSAYRKGQCKESALIKMILSITLPIRSAGCLNLIDFSVAFDIINQTLLLSPLQADFGFQEHVLDWFTSYLSDRVQCVTIEKSFSNSSFLHFGVPRGSVLGHLLYTI